MCTVKKIEKFINSNILVTDEDIEVNFQIWYLHTHMYLFLTFHWQIEEKKVIVTNGLITGRATLINSAESLLN
jgi:hypothetical protein